MSDGMYTSLQCIERSLVSKGQNFFNNPCLIATMVTWSTTTIFTWCTRRLRPGPQQHGCRPRSRRGTRCTRCNRSQTLGTDLNRKNLWTWFYHVFPIGKWLKLVLLKIPNFLISMGQNLKVRKVTMYNHELFSSWFHPPPCRTNLYAPDDW